MTPEEIDGLYMMLSSQYTLISGRTETLATRAQQLLSFGGIANAILVAIIVQVTNPNSRTFLTENINLSLLGTVVITGVIFYVLSVFFSLLAFRTKKYMPVPQIGSKFVDAVISGTTKLDKGLLLRQIAEAIDYHQNLNDKKYLWLLLGTICLLIAVVFTAILGIILFMPIV